MEWKTLLNKHKSRKHHHWLVDYVQSVTENTLVTDIVNFHQGWVIPYDHVMVSEHFVLPEMHFRWGPPLYELFCKPYALSYVQDVASHPSVAFCISMSPPQKKSFCIPPCVLLCRLPLSIVCLIKLSLTTAKNETKYNTTPPETNNNWYCNEKFKGCNFFSKLIAKKSILDNQIYLREKKWHSELGLNFSVIFWENANKFHSK